MFLKETRQVGHLKQLVSELPEVSESVSEEEKSDEFGVKVNVGDAIGEPKGETTGEGDARGEVGEPNREDKLDAEVLLLLLGLSGVRNDDSKVGGGQD